jgi:hypothetical protein
VLSSSALCDAVASLRLWNVLPLPVTSLCAGSVLSSLAAVSFAPLLPDWLGPRTSGLLGSLVVLTGLVQLAVWAAMFVWTNGCGGSGAAISRTLIAFQQGPRGGRITTVAGILLVVQRPLLPSLCGGSGVISVIWAATFILASMVYGGAVFGTVQHW